MTFQPDDYREFRYDGWQIDGPTGVVTSSFSLVGVDTVSFTEQVTLPAPLPRPKTAEPLAKLLALASGLSYYKAAAPAVVTVPAGLTPAERRFLTELIAGGLGEFAYRNDRPAALTPQIEADPLEPTAHGRLLAPDAPPLVAVGGGKDSVVSIETLKAAGLDPRLFSVNRYAAIDRCVAVADRPYAAAPRQLDPHLFELNRAGAYNGHVPVTAINSLVGLMTALSLGAGPVVLSNEASASYGNLTWAGREINHQWSKSLDFENLLRDTLTASYEPPAPYFSLLRPLTELQIAERFAHLPAYFGAFTSCNRSFALDQARRATHWCCDCPKCFFVYLILAAWLDPADLIGIFGQNILDQPHEAKFAEILGYTGHKPFECVGDYAEARAALRLVAARPAWQAASLVQVLSPRLADFDDQPAPADPGLAANLPASYRAALGA